MHHINSKSYASSITSMTRPGSQQFQTGPAETPFDSCQYQHSACPILLNGLRKSFLISTTVSETPSEGSSRTLREVLVLRTGLLAMNTYPSIPMSQYWISPTFRIVHSRHALSPTSSFKVHLIQDVATTIEYSLISIGPFTVRLFSLHLDYALTLMNIFQTSLNHGDTSHGETIHLSLKIPAWTFPHSNSISLAAGISMFQQKSRTSSSFTLVLIIATSIR